MKLIRRLFLVALCCFALNTYAQMTPSQITTLRAVVLAEPTLATARQNGDDYAIAAWLNAPATPAFTVWKTNVSVTAVGDNLVGTELAGLTSLNTSRLQAIIMLSPVGVNPSLADRRAFFDDVFSGTGGVLTRGKLLTLWKRLATRAEKALATGIGTDAAPATLTWESTVSVTDASLLR